MLSGAPLASLDGLLRPARELLEDVVLQVGLAPQPGVQAAQRCSAA